MAKVAVQKRRSKDFDVTKLSVAMCERLLADLEKAKRPVLKATKCALDNCLYDPKVGF